MLSIRQLPTTSTCTCLISLFLPGDAQYKPYVTANPEIVSVDLDGDEDFVVVACDGLWDFVSEDDVALAVYRQLAADPGES